MYEIGKRFKFSAKHRLPFVDPDHKCYTEHGHNYKVHLIMRAEFLTEEEWVFDYGAMSDFGDYIDEVFDHGNVNDAVYPGTAEAIAHHLYDLAAATYGSDLVFAVTVQENGGTYATYTLSDPHTGGVVSPGETALVGERGPEPFVPESP